jgi:CRP/FNR family transcriptional regulator, cyclic AMP receptor protein
MANPLRAGFFHTQNILAGLPQPYSSRLLANARGITLTEGKTLFERGDAGDGCYWLEEGILKVSIASPRGEQRILAILGPGSIVGELAMIDGLPRSATVEAVRDSRLTFVSRMSFVSCLRDHPEIYSYLVTTLVARLRQADEETAAASFLTVKARVARALLQLAEHLGEPTGGDQITIHTNIRQNDLAAMAGVARESVSRTLGEWRRRAVIGQSTRYKYVVNKSKLEREARARS